MNKWMRAMAGLLAGLMLAGALAACSDSASTGTFGDYEDEEKNYNDLSPADVYEALQEADDYTVSVIVSETQGTKSSQTKMEITKDESRLQVHTRQSDSFTVIAEIDGYMDLDAQKVYAKENGVWVAQSEAFDMKRLVDEALQGKSDVLFDNGNYIDAKDGYYKSDHTKMDGLGAAYGEGYTCTLSADCTGAQYEFLLSYFKDQHIYYIKATIAFADTQVILPTLGSDKDPNAGGNLLPGTLPPVTQNPTTQKPVTQKPVTEKPATQTQKPVTDKPVTPPTPTLTYLTPAKLFKAIENAGDITIEIEQNGVKFVARKDGDHVLWETAEYDQYFDLSTGYVYQQINGEWKNQYVAYDWSSFMLQLGLDYGAYYFADRYYNQFDESDRTLSVNTSLVVGLQSAVLERSEDCYVLTERRSDGQYCIYTFRISESNSFPFPV